MMGGDILLYNLNWRESENIKINNTETSALIEDASETLSYFADKYIITKYPIKTGDLVEYAGITYIVVSQIDRNIENRKENQYNYRARIRQADFIIKMVIDGNVETIPSIIEGVKFDILEGQFIRLSDDKIIVTLKANDVTNKIKKEMRFIKLGSAWKVVGIDKTKLGLISLFCNTDVFGVNDDIENEIADKNLIETGSPEEPEEPKNITYSITSIDNYGNTNNLEIYSEDWRKYTVHKFIDDVEVAGTFTFEIDNPSYVTIQEQTDSTIKIYANDTIKDRNIKLTMTDTETDQIAIEINIIIRSY